MLGKLMHYLPLKTSEVPIQLKKGRVICTKCAHELTPNWLIDDRVQNLRSTSILTKKCNCHGDAIAKYTFE